MIEEHGARNGNKRQIISKVCKQQNFQRVQAFSPLRIFLHKRLQRFAPKYNIEDAPVECNGAEQPYHRICKQKYALHAVKLVYPEVNTPAPDRPLVKTRGILVFEVLRGIYIEHFFIYLN